jgi:hypothetical protein
MRISGRGIIKNLHPSPSTLAQTHSDLILAVCIDVPTGRSSLAVGTVV